MSLAIAGFCWQAGAGRALATQVGIVPGTSIVGLYSVFTVDIAVQDATQLYGVDLQLAFDIETLEAQSVSKGSFLPASVFEAQRVVDNVNGQVRYVAALMPPAVALDGSGVVARVQFRARNAGSSPLDLTVMLADLSAQPILAAVNHGLVTVQGEAPTPTWPATPRRAYLPIVLRSWFVPGPEPTLTSTATATPSPTPTGSTVPSFTLTRTPTGSASPSATPTRTATASATRSATPSPTPTVSPTPSSPHYVQLLVNPSFETDEAWEFPPTDARAGYSVSQVRTGVRSVRLGIISPYSAVYSSVEQVVDIPAGALEAVLSLYYFPVSSHEDADQMYIALFRASDGVQLAPSIRWMSRFQTWTLKTVDLRPFAGQRVRLRIGLYNDGNGVTTVHLDDVELWVRAAP